MFKKLFKGVLDVLDRPLSVFFTFHLRPKKSEKIGVFCDKLVDAPRVAIVIQGPLLKKDNFTLETVKMYKKLFSGYPIIVSVWEDEDVECVEKIRGEGVRVILNKKPEYSGISHINYQILATYNAIKKAKDLGVDYVLKTRTDLRIYNPNSIEFLVNFVNFFPVNIKYRQKKRIAVASLNTFKYRPYSISDLILFGHVDDMVDYWSVNHDTRKEFPAFEKMGDWSKARLCEVYLSTSYLEKIGCQIEWTLVDSWRKFADNFCVFDQQCLDIYWHKYRRFREYRKLRYDSMYNDQEMSFCEWFSIYSGMGNKNEIPEYLLNEVFDEKRVENVQSK